MKELIKYKVYVIDQGLYTNVFVDAESEFQARTATLHSHPNVIVQRIVIDRPNNPSPTKKVA